MKGDAPAGVPVATGSYPLPPPTCNDSRWERAAGLSTLRCRHAMLAASSPSLLWQRVAPAVDDMTQVQWLPRQLAPSSLPLPSWEEGDEHCYTARRQGVNTRV